MRAAPPGPQSDDDTLPSVDHDEPPDRTEPIRRIARRGVLSTPIGLTTGAYRFPPDLTIDRPSADEVREATVWIDGLERINRHRTILRAVDCSATPMYPSAFKDRAWTPFEWIVSDFALVEAPSSPGS